MKRMGRSLLLSSVLLGSVAHPADLVSHASLTLEGAKGIAATAVQFARDHAAPGAAIAVVDPAGTLVYLEKLDGTFQNASLISIGKARTSVLFGKPTRVFEDAVNKGRYAMLAVPEVAPFTPLMGGVPLEAGGQVVGAVGVSGAASAAQDDEIAAFAAAEFAKRHAADASVQRIPATQVSQAFHDDANLITQGAVRINASHRDAAGEAEIHQRDADIFYVTKGSAQLVTGGQLISPRQTGDAEIRGASIDGGETMHLNRGDVVSIPRGVPHWFKRVDAPFEYYVVKSTAP